MEKEQMEILISEYLPSFFAFAHSKLYDYEEAEDLAQEIMFQCVTALRKQNEILNLNAFLWSIAHNTVKRWYARKKFYLLSEDVDTYTNLWHCERTMEDTLLDSEERNQVRLEVSRLSKYYRRTLVCFYYEERSIREIAEELCISQEMVKFYLTKGRQKVKERLTMDEIGKKSIQPAQFHIYKSAIDFSKVNVWKVFEHILPRQIALICHDAAKEITAISIESGVPAVYIEDELRYLMDAGVMVEQAKGKYRTNFHIMKQEEVNKLSRQFELIYDGFLPTVQKVWKEYLPKLRKCKLFQLEVPEQRYYWFLMLNTAAADERELGIPDQDYPQILACGSRAFLFAEEAPEELWCPGMTPTFLDTCTVKPCDITIMKTHCQEQLRSKQKAQALYDVYEGCRNESDRELYAQLIEEGYVVKQKDILYCNVPVVTKEIKVLLHEMNELIYPDLAETTRKVYGEVLKSVKGTIPEQLKRYAEGYAKTWVSALSSIRFEEALYKHDVITIPAENERAPYACCIEMK